VLLKVWDSPKKLVGARSLSKIFTGATTPPDNSPRPGSAPAPAPSKPVFAAPAETPVLDAIKVTESPTRGAPPTTSAIK
jgi:hypothetical protein